MPELVEFYVNSNSKLKLDFFSNSVKKEIIFATPDDAEFSFPFLLGIFGGQSTSIYKREGFSDFYASVLFDELVLIMNSCNTYKIDSYELGVSDNFSSLKKFLKKSKVNPENTKPLKDCFNGKNHLIYPLNQFHLIGKNDCSIIGSLLG